MRIHILDARGQIIKVISEFNGTIDVSELAKGVYYTHIYVNNHYLTKKFVKQLKIMKYFISFLISVTILVACKKDKVEGPVENAPTKWEQIVGDYKVYDTLGVYLYDMSISHSYNDQTNQDILFFQNFDFDFDFETAQPFPGSNPEFYIRVGYHDTLYDTLSNRWKVLLYLDDVYNNVLQNDTIKLGFTKTNINYYLLDLVPYYSCDCKQIAVKQP